MDRDIQINSKSIQWIDFSEQGVKMNGSLHARWCIESVDVDVYVCHHIRINPIQTYLYKNQFIKKSIKIEIEISFNGCPHEFILSEILWLFGFIWKIDIHTNGFDNNANLLINEFKGK